MAIQKLEKYRMAGLIPKTLRLMIFAGSVYLMASGIFFGKGEIILTGKPVTSNFTEVPFHIKRSPIIFIKDKNKNGVTGGRHSGNCSDCDSRKDENHILYCCDTFTMCCKQAEEIKCPANNTCNIQGRFCKDKFNCVNGEKCCESSPSKNKTNFKCCWSPAKVTKQISTKTKLSNDC